MGAIAVAGLERQHLCNAGCECCDTNVDLSPQRLLVVVGRLDVELWAQRTATPWRECTTGSNRARLKLSAVRRVASEMAAAPLTGVEPALSLSRGPNVLVASTAQPLVEHRIDVVTQSRRRGLRDILVELEFHAARSARSLDCSSGHC